MAATTPTPSNGCKGTFANGDPDLRLKCVKELDDEGEKVFNCATMRLFRVNCSKINRQCNTISAAYVPAITVCSQRLF